MIRRSTWWILAIGISAVAIALAAQRMNEFVIDDDALIPAAKIHSGGPPRDGIPSIDQPIFLAADGPHQLDPDDEVLGLKHNGVARAYPVAIMNYHEIVNDRFGDQPVVVTYCPLCGSGIAYQVPDGEGDTTFGVSGLLYNSDVLLYDRQTDSLWSQMMSQAVSGPRKGERLTMLPLVHTSWAAWQAEHGSTQVLSRETGFSRDYERDPYAGYQDSYGVWFPVENRDPRYHPKERVLGLELNGRYKAYPMSELSKGRGELQDQFAGQSLRIRYNADADSATLLDVDGKTVPTVNSFWFAWYAFHPETEVFTLDP